MKKEQVYTHRFVIGSNEFISDAETIKYRIQCLDYVLRVKMGMSLITVKTTNTNTEEIEEIIKQNIGVL